MMDRQTTRPIYYQLGILPKIIRKDRMYVPKGIFLISIVILKVIYQTLFGFRIKYLAKMRARSFAKNDLIFGQINTFGISTIILDLSITF